MNFEPHLFSHTSYQPTPLERAPDFLSSEAEYSEFYLEPFSVQSIQHCLLVMVDKLVASSLDPFESCDYCGFMVVPWYRRLCLCGTLYCDPLCQRRARQLHRSTCQAWAIIQVLEELQLHQRPEMLIMAYLGIGKRLVRRYVYP